MTLSPQSQVPLTHSELQHHLSEEQNTTYTATSIIGRKEKNEN